MTIYKVALGFDAADELLEPLVFQPRSDGVRPLVVNPTPLGAVEHGLYAVLVWNVLEGAEEYQAVLAQLGLNSGVAREVTITLPNFTRNWDKYNGVALRPVPGEDVRWNFFPRDLTIIVRDLQAFA